MGENFWTPFILLSGACGSGFIFLLVRTLQNSAKINECATYKYLNDEFYRKEMIDVYMKNIDANTIKMANDIHVMTIKLDKVLLANLKVNGKK